MAVILGLLASITYGSADFLGGLFTRRAGVLTVVLVSQLMGTLLLLAALPFFLDERFSSSGVAWGAASGVAGAAGVTMLFRGLARGRMSIVAPITGTVAAGIPVIVGLVSGERPAPIALLGVGLALAAVALVSASEHASSDKDAGDEEVAPRASGIPEALGAGTSFGLFFVLLDQAGDASGLWPLVGARASSLTVIAVAALVTRAALKPPPGTLGGISLAGFLDVAANLFYLLATRQGLLALVAVLTSMYPATTVLLARVMLKEKLSSTQLVGLGLAFAGVIAIAGG
ncbi:MAG: DMT family transporter [Actinomycetota bacterium]|nr:DMT family transporter [Actinomycetota bacterium]